MRTWFHMSNLLIRWKVSIVSLYRDVWQRQGLRIFKVYKGTYLGFSNEHREVPSDDT